MNADTLRHEWLPLVSIVVNNYNYERFLREAIKSALNQSYRHTEIIVVDDGSTDGSREIISSFGDRVISIFKENGGQASAFNVGINAASGEFIVLLDADDILSPTAVEVALRNHEDGCSRVSGQLKFIDSSGEPIGRETRYKVYLKDAITGYALTGEFPAVPTSGNFFSSAILKRIIPIPEEEYRISADLYLLVETAMRGHVKVIPDVLAHYRLHGRNNFSGGFLNFSHSRLVAQARNLVQLRSCLSDALRRRGLSATGQPETRVMHPLIRISYAKAFSKDGLGYTSYRARSLSREAIKVWLNSARAFFKASLGALLVYACLLVYTLRVLLAKSRDRGN